MPFFENARQFEINGGNFIDVKGNQNNYHYDQSLKVSGQGNSASYLHGPYYNGGDNRTYNNGERMTVIGQGSHAQVALGTNSMPWNHSQQNFPPPPGQSYGGYPQANAPPQAQPQGYGPPNGMFHHSTGHLNPPYSHPPSPPQPQSQQYPEGYGYSPSPPSTQPVSPQYPASAIPYPTSAVPYFPPTHHSQTSVHSTPPAVNIPPIQIIQNGHQRNASHSSGLNTVPQQLQQSPQQPQSPQPQQSPPPPQAANGLLSAPGVQSSPSASSSSGSVVSGTTLAQSPQPALIVTPPVTPSAAPATTASTPANTPSTIATTTTAATTATAGASILTSSTSSPTTQGQQQTGNPAPTTVAPFSDFPGLKLRPGAPTPAAILAEDEKKKKKKKKGNFFSRLFKRSKETTAAAATVAASAVEV